MGPVVEMAMAGNGKPRTERRHRTRTNSIRVAAVVQELLTRLAFPCHPSTECASPATESQSSDNHNGHIAGQARSYRRPSGPRPRALAAAYAVSSDADEAGRPNAKLRNAQLTPDMVMQA